MKTLYVFSSLLILFIISSTFAPKTYANFSDTFTNSNGTSLSSHNSDYTVTYGSVEIQSNKVHPASSGFHAFKYPESNNDYEACIDATNALEGLFIRANSSLNSSYQLVATGDNTSSTPTVYTYVDGTAVNNHTGDSITIEGNHTYCLSAHGTTITAKYDGTPIVSFTDTNISSGTNVGFGIHDYTSLSWTNPITDMDNFVITYPEVHIAADPLGGTKTVGSPFTIDIKVQDGNSSFNAVRSTVTVSSNLTINSIHNATSNACNLQYTLTPTVSNPSFAGAVFGSSKNNCILYRMTVTPNASGTGTVTFTNGSVKSYDLNAEILTNVDNASFTLSNGPTPTPTSTLDFTIENLLHTYKENFDLTGTKTATITHIVVNGNDNAISGTTWSVPVTLSFDNDGNNPFTIYGEDDNSNQTASQSIVVKRHHLGDINGDGQINLVDASLFAVDWDKTSGLTYNLSDMNDDGVVDLTDLSILAKLEE